MPLHETIPLGRIAGIRIGAHWSALVTLAIFTLLLGQSLVHDNGNSLGAWMIAVIGAVTLFVSLVAHEVAHSIMARRSGVRVERIVLWLLGGVSELDDEPKDARSDLWIALAGPLTSVGIGALLFGLAGLVAFGTTGPVLQMLVWAASVNLVLAVFNMLPGAPLDGGRVVRALVWRSTGDRLRAATVAARNGRILGMVMLFLGAAELIISVNFGGLWLILLGWFLLSAANGELALAGLRHRLGDIRIRDVMSEHPVSVPIAWSIGDVLGSPAMRTHHRVFPVVDSAGRPVAVLSYADLSAQMTAAGPTALIAKTARPLPPAAKVDEDTLLSEAASRAVLRPDLDLIAAVDRFGRLSGVVTATDLALACHRSALGLPVRAGQLGDRTSSAR
ncbi:site-2 protease family protein [Nocardia arthritidis]|nr:site-2 protease family protein [Nocardia arthritidis]